MLSKYNEKTIHYFNEHLLQYLNNIDSINTDTHDGSYKIKVQGFKTLLHVLSVIHTINMPEQQINSYLEKCPLLFIEYTEQVYLKKNDTVHTPDMFVYNVLLGNLTLDQHKITNSPFITQLSKWSHTIPFWENSKFINDQREYLVANFMKSYLLTFINDDKHDLYRIIEIIQGTLKDDVNVFNKYTLILTSFINYFSDNTDSFTKEDVQQICFDKFLREQDQYKEHISNAENIKNTDIMIKWIFE
jgi:hypothetical protein